MSAKWCCVRLLALSCCVAASEFLRDHRGKARSRGVYCREVRRNKASLLRTWERPARYSIYSVRFVAAPAVAERGFQFHHQSCLLYFPVCWTACEGRARQEGSGAPFRRTLARNQATDALYPGEAPAQRGPLRSERSSDGDGVWLGSIGDSKLHFWPSFKRPLGSARLELPAYAARALLGKLLNLQKLVYIPYMHHFFPKYYSNCIVLIVSVFHPNVISLPGQSGMLMADNGVYVKMSSSRVSWPLVLLRIHIFKLFTGSQ